MTVRQIVIKATRSEPGDFVEFASLVVFLIGAGLLMVGLK